MKPHLSMARRLRRTRSITILAGLLLGLSEGTGWSVAWAQTLQVERHESLRVVQLSGTPYHMGREHGSVLRDDIRQMTATVLGYFRRYLKIPVVSSWLASWWLDRAWRRAKPFIPPAYLEELRGLSDGSGVPLRELYRIHAIPDRTYACSSFAAWGPITSDGRLIHSRNLDWNVEVGIQRYAVVFAVHPDHGRAFLNIGWAGFIGVLTGVNDAQISIGQIGAETTDAAFRGLPMPFLMRRVLEETGTLEEAVRIIQEAPRTVGINYVIADAKARRAVAVETTRHHVAVFEADDPREHGVRYAYPMASAVFRADTAMDPDIRDCQLASNGNPNRPGLEDPTGSSAYDVRYVGQATELKARSGRLDLDQALGVVKAVAPGSNVQSVLFAWPDVLVANAQGARRAAHTPYHHLNAAELLAPAN